MKISFASILALALLVLPPASGISQSLTISGSDTLLDLSRKWADAYNAQHSGARVQVSGGDAATAFAALAEKKIEIALTSSLLRFKEADACVAAFGKRPAEYKVAVNALAVYVNATNPVKTLTYDELFSIYSGLRKNWKDFDGG